MNWIAFASFLIGGLLVIALAPYQLTISQRWWRVSASAGGSVILGLTIPVNWEGVIVIAAIGIPLMMPLIADYGAILTDKIRLLRSPFRFDALQQIERAGYVVEELANDG
ncbi:MAG: hypothetical protein M9928_15460 [Anaerolineae bacterium]|nr:hypothetical protein [Anaerolineae bacterium]MCO5194590.1 hypothetical protein [Anaerolineae bacterium]MCO5199215.1 hypothetical protein [Anaerolineae bacterium]MCO5206433.1 hypothetical protein [Anaerolineae bacterium]